jgi:hypothetical protein
MLIIFNVNNIDVISRVLCIHLKLFFWKTILISEVLLLSGVMISIHDYLDVSFFTGYLLRQRYSVVLDTSTAVSIQCTYCYHTLVVFNM